MQSTASLVTLVVIDFLFGALIAWTYAAIRPRLGPGASTAMAAGFVIWSAWTLMMATFGGWFVPWDSCDAIRGSRSGGLCRGGVGQWLGVPGSRPRTRPGGHAVNSRVRRPMPVASDGRADAESHWQFRAERRDAASPRQLSGTVMPIAPWMLVTVDPYRTGGSAVRIPRYATHAATTTAAVASSPIDSRSPRQRRSSRARCPPPRNRSPPSHSWVLAPRITMTNNGRRREHALLVRQAPSAPRCRRRGTRSNYGYNTTSSANRSKHHRGHAVGDVSVRSGERG